jgi:hypothetical protein
MVFLLARFVRRRDALFRSGVRVVPRLYRQPQTIACLDQDTLNLNTMLFGLID